MVQDWELYWTHLQKKKKMVTKPLIKRYWLPPSSYTGWCLSHIYVPVLQKEPEVATEVIVIHFSYCWISTVATMYYMKYTLVSSK